MKVFYVASPRAFIDYEPNLEAIGNIIKELGHKHTTTFITKKELHLEFLPREKYKEHYKQIMDALEIADVAVIENTITSTSLGQCVQAALLKGKPVIVLYAQARNEVFMEGAGDVESKLIVVNYNLDNLKEELSRAFEYVENWLETRFTMILDGETRRLLDQVAQNGVSRSEYIRELIRKDAQK